MTNYYAHVTVLSYIAFKLCCKHGLQFIVRFFVWSLRKNSLKMVTDFTITKKIVLGKLKFFSCVCNFVIRINSFIKGNFTALKIMLKDFRKKNRKTQLHRKCDILASCESLEKNLFVVGYIY